MLFPRFLMNYSDDKCIVKLGIWKSSKFFVSGFSDIVFQFFGISMSHFAYACKTEGQNGISRLISTLCVNCLISIPDSIICMSIWSRPLQKLHKLKNSEHLNSKVSFEL